MTKKILGRFLRWCLRHIDESDGRVFHRTQIIYPPHINVSVFRIITEENFNTELEIMYSEIAKQSRGYVSCTNRQSALFNGDTREITLSLKVIPPMT